MTVRRTFVLAVLLLLAPPTWAAKPKAEITGPTTALAGERVLLDVSGSASDAETPLQVKVVGAGDTPSIRLWYDEGRKPGLAVFTAPRPGSYVVVVVAMGKEDGAAIPTFDFSPWPLEITLPGPAPKPDPNPPPPPPPPNPDPPPIAGNLWGVLVLPELPSAKESALRTSPTLRAAFTASNAHYRSYLASESEVQGAAWKAALAAAGGPPVVLWMGDAGKLLKTTKVADEAGVLADLKALRGGK